MAVSVATLAVGESNCPLCVWAVMEHRWERVAASRFHMLGKLSGSCAVPCCAVTSCTCGAAVLLAIECKCDVVGCAGVLCCAVCVCVQMRHVRRMPYAAPSVSSASSAQCALHAMHRQHRRIATSLLVASGDAVSETLLSV